MIHKEITDKQWELIQKHLSKPAKTGRPRCDDRTIINGILFVLTVGCRWKELPEKYDSTKFIDVMESISDFVDDESIRQIVFIYADKSYDTKYLSELVAQASQKGNVTKVQSK